MIFYTLFAVAQARHPKAVGKIMRKLTSAAPGSAKKKKRDSSSAGGDNGKARLPVHEVGDRPRTDGIQAANRAAGVPED